MKAQNFLLLFIAILLASCKSYYAAQNLKEVAQSHQTIAILPFEIYTQGYLPEEITESEIEQIQEYESRSFQISFYNKILRRNRLVRTATQVDVQHYNETLRKLKESNISILESWEKSPKLLAKVLEVDAIVIGRIEKQRYFSDELAASIDLGRSILNRIGVNQVPYVSRNNKNIRADYSVLDPENGKVLWSINYDCQANWQQQPDQIIDDINHRSSRYFPYRVE